MPFIFYKNKKFFTKKIFKKIFLQKNIYKKIFCSIIINVKETTNGLEKILRRYPEIYKEM